MTPQTDAAHRHACKLFSFLAWCVIAFMAVTVMSWLALAALFVLAMGGAS